ncbi:PREDICTED: PRKC apoptosis WT1 regulator protein [Chaetura pelagica]|uniref:PRKC apoptosis WT1 regulator protein n=1 Tax=Chaetura pelagica TaxID=8897 RepID=UPI000523EEF2|nr:PREDICTED: PRKC apoptosis WT1 regulator protein [Chaetura pelagica]
MWSKAAGVAGERRASIVVGQQSIGLESINKERLKGRLKRDSSTMFGDYVTFRGRVDIRNVIEHRSEFYRKVRGKLWFIRLIAYTNRGTGSASLDFPAHAFSLPFSPAQPGFPAEFAVTTYEQDISQAFCSVTGRNLVNRCFLSHHESTGSHAASRLREETPPSNFALPPGAAHGRRSLRCGSTSACSHRSLDEYEDDEAGQKERKKEDAITQQNTIQNESSSAETPGSYLLQDSSRMVSSRYKSTANAPEDDAPNRYPRTDRTTYSRYSRDANSSGSSVPNNALEKRIEELERELAKERQENVRLMKMTQDKEELIGKLKEEIDLLNRDLDDIEDENEQLKQENKTLLKVVGQLTR